MVKKQFLIFLLTGISLFYFNVVGCRPKELRLVGSSCGDDSQCASGVCIDSACRSSLGDFDGDGLANGEEVAYYHTDPGNPDTDGDGIPDGQEVKSENGGTTPPDDDGDGIINALESKVLSEKSDPDHDCIPNQFDPQNDVPDHSANAKTELKDLFCLKGICKDYADKITANCVQGKVSCDFSSVPGWRKVETECDTLDNDCDGQTDEGLVRSPGEMDPNPCPAKGVCADYRDLVKVECKAGKWACNYSEIKKHEPSFEGVEVTCDGLDNDCDGMTDEIKPEPGSLHGCNAKGVCGGENANLIQAVCVDGHWSCDYSQVKGFQAKETLCDDLDNNCDGQTDEVWPEKGNECKVGQGECMNTGNLVCSDDQSKLVCDVTPGTPASGEICGNNKDDDCNGLTDDYCGTPVNLSFTVTVPNRAGGTAAHIEFYKAAACGSDGQMSGEPVLTKEAGLGEILNVSLPSGAYCMQVYADGYEKFITGVFNLYENEIDNKNAWPINIILDQADSAESTVNVIGRMFIFKHNPSQLAGISVQAVLKNGEMQSLGNIEPIIKNGHYSLAGLPLALLPSTGQGKPEPVKAYSLKMSFESGIPDLVRTVLVDPTAQGYPGLIISDFSVYPADKATCFADGFEDMDVSAMIWGDGSGGVSISYTNVYWQQVSLDSNISNSAFGKCATLSDWEKNCKAGDPECCKCSASSHQNGCLSQSGALPKPYEGNGAVWFGNSQTGNYMDIENRCVAGGTEGGTSTPVSGTWETNDYMIDLTRADWAQLSFRTAFEVEGVGANTDIMDKMHVFLENEGGKQIVIDNLNKDFCTQTTDICTSGKAMPCWQQVNLDLSMYKGNRYKLGFRFDSVDGMRNAYRGWMIDDIRVTGIGCLVLDDTPQ